MCFCIYGRVKLIGHWNNLHWFIGRHYRRKYSVQAPTIFSSAIDWCFSPILKKSLLNRLPSGMVNSAFTGQAIFILGFPEISKDTNATRFLCVHPQQMVAYRFTVEDSAAVIKIFQEKGLIRDLVWLAILLRPASVKKISLMAQESTANSRVLKHRRKLWKQFRSRLRNIITLRCAGLFDLQISMPLRFEIWSLTISDLIR